MYFKYDKFWSNTLDFLVATLVILIASRYVRDVIDFLVPPLTLDNYIVMPKFYLSFIEGLISGVLLSVYILFKKNINLLFIILGMWFYPLNKFISFTLFPSLESILIYLSQLSMFIGIVVVIYYFTLIIKDKLNF